MSVRNAADAGLLLAAAVALLQPRQEAVYLRVRWRGAEYGVRFDWPGVVSVLSLSGEVSIVSSVAGDPSTVAEWQED
jgi:hypothetical protein